MPRTVEFREYVADDAAVFRKTNERFGGLSNMAPGFPISVNGHHIRTSEALYQACRFPHMPEVQQLVIEQKSPMTAKMKSKPHRRNSRSDWDAVRVTIMRWCLRVKLAQNWATFSRLLETTADLPIVEESKRDDFWGAKPTDDGRLVGANVLGRLLMELRQLLREQPQESLTVVDPPRIPQFLLFGVPIERVGSTAAVAAPMATTTLFEPADQEVVPVARPPKPEAVLVTRDETPHMTDFPRLIEHAFPLKQASLDSVHEKNVRHGHISTLHIWPARRPLAACRAALLATLLPDPGSAEKRKALCERIGGRVVKKIQKKKMPGGQTVERVKEETEGGILHWLESEPPKSNKKKWREWKARSDHYNAELEWFRQEIRKAYGGRPPNVLDPFAGGGAIPLEAMRLGCEATAVDINPVAWFILKCTLEYPQRLAGKTRPLPDFILHDDAFMADFFKRAKGYSKAETTAALKHLHKSLKKKTKGTGKGEQGGLPFASVEISEGEELQADLAWHVRAWGHWVLTRARKELAEYYPTYADFEPLKKDQVSYERQPRQLVPLTDHGTPDVDALNGEFTEEYLDDPRNPRWVAKPTVAYLWARTVNCKNCRATVPLLKTRWLCRKANKRVLLAIEPNEERTGVTFGVDNNVPAKGGNAAQKREHDRRIGTGTMSRAGVKCPCCGAITTGEDIRLDGQAGALGVTLTTVVVDGGKGKQYRTPTAFELEQYSASVACLPAVAERIPFGFPSESISPDRPSPNTRGASGLPRFGVDDWGKAFSPRQKLAIGTFLVQVRAALAELVGRNEAPEWREAVVASLCCSLDRMIDFNSELCTWILGVEAIRNTFVRYALPFASDFGEAAIPNDGRGGFSMCVEKTAQSLETIKRANAPHLSTPEVVHGSALGLCGTDMYDVICTDPPYYDAIPYSDVVDFFHVWLRRSASGLSPQVDEAFRDEHGPKWRAEEADGELVDQPSRFRGDRDASRENYERGMATVFSSCHSALRATGRLVVVFANKQPAAWETLVSALIRGGFVVDGTWPIQTEQAARMQAVAGAALASSVWLVCKKRPLTARPGWDNRVLEEMRENIAAQLREFWDAGIRGPDFVWAATGPALEAFSKHPVVRKANEANATMGVGEFLNHVRRMVVDYVVGQVLTGQQGADMAAADRLDEVTAYYLLHRHDFGLDEAPVGACILYATACGLSDSELERTWDILSGGGKKAASLDEFDDTDDEDTDEDADADTDSSSSGSKVKLKAWTQRRGKSMGLDAPEGKAVPLIDRIHRLMHLWRSGDLHKVDEYIDEHGLRRNELFKRVVQSLIELSTSSERSLLESISNHIGGKGSRLDEEERAMAAVYRQAGHGSNGSEDEL